MKISSVNKLVSQMKKDGFDAVLICPSEELKYFTGNTLMMCKRFQGLVIKSDSSAFYICNTLYKGEVEKNLSGIKLYTWFDSEDMPDSVGKILIGEGLHGKKVGVNSAAPAYWILDITRTAGITFVNAMPTFEEMRVIKTDEELVNLQKAADISDAVFDKVVRYIRHGLKEADIRNFLLTEMEKLGGTGAWAIVACKPNCSYPHYSGTDGVVCTQDVVLLDFGCIYNDMRSDMSRMVFVGGISDKEREVYEICRKATKAGQDACFEGAYIPNIDAAARNIISDAGYGDYFEYRVGHGIGYMIHEEPYIKVSNTRYLEKGMVFSIEPGINIPGEFGMRVENIVAITSNGTEILNKSSDEIIIV